MPNNEVMTAEEIHDFGIEIVAIKDNKLAFICISCNLTLLNRN